MSGTLPTPRSTARMASRRYGTSSRFTMKPEVSFAATGSLPSDWVNANARRKVSSDVVTVRTTSTSGIRGTGLKKWSPTNRSARCVAAAMAAGGRGGGAPAAGPPPPGPPPPPPPRRISVIALSNRCEPASSGAAPPGGGVEGLAEFLGDAGERGHARAGERVLGLDFAVLDAVEHLLQAHLDAFVLAAVAAGDGECGGPRHDRGDSRPGRERAERRQHSREHGAPQDEQRRAPQPARALAPHVGDETHVTEAGLERGHLASHFRRAGERERLPARAERALDRGECADPRLPGGAVWVAALHLERFLALHPDGDGSLDGALVARHHALGREQRRSREPGEQPRPAGDHAARLLLEQRLPQVARRDADVVPQRQHLRLGEPLADVPLPGLELGGALDGPLEGLAADELARHR